MTSLERVAAMRADRLAEIATDLRGHGLTAVELWSPSGLVTRLLPGPAELPNPRGRPQTGTRRRSRAALRVPIGSEDQPVGWIRALGSSSVPARRRLAMHAAELGALASAEGELDELAAALVESHDHVAALVALGRVARSDGGGADAMPRLAREIRTLVGGLPTAVAVEDQAGLNVAGDPPEWAAALERSAPQLLDAAKEAHATGEASRSVTLALASEAATSTVRIAPMASDGPVHACVIVRQPAGPDWTAAATGLLEAGADLAASLFAQRERHAMELAALRIRTELDLGAAVQQQLLPAFEAPAGLDVAVRYRPANEIGGDLVDLGPLPDGRTALTVGDVSGKGVAAALMAAGTRAAVRLGARSAPDPAGALELAGADLSNDLDRVGAFVTLFHGNWHPVRSLMTYTNAGHAPVLLRRVGQRARLLEPGAPPLGVAEPGTLAQEQLVLSPGDLLVIGTDGLMDAQNPEGESFGLDPLIGLVDRLEHSDAAGAADAILAAVDLHAAGARRPDDQTLLVACRVP